MQSIKGKNTSPELAVRSYLHRKGLRFSLHQRRLPGTPDIVLRKYKTVVFVHGCFWHHHSDPSCPFSKKPKTNRDYWIPKLERTVQRDTVHAELLKQQGWFVETIWECHINESELSKLATRITTNTTRH